MQVNIYEAKTRLSELVEQAHAGATVIIAKAGTPMAKLVPLDADLVARIRKQIRDGASPRHVPAKIVAVADIPRTKSGKITELAVRDVVHGREVKNKEALANPEALELYRDIAELQV